MYNQVIDPFKVSIFIGGPPAHTFAAVMPLPEGLSELTFAGMLNGRRFRFTRKDGYVISADADFCITGTIAKDVKKPEGPFGDHLGYYSLKHDFPVLKIHKVYHRKGAIWPFTVVGRPPQEDTSFGHLIHEIAGPLLPKEFPGVKEVNAVDAAGVHPLLLAIGSERYMPFRERRPEEILTQANHLLGKGQTSLAKYLFIAADGDDPALSTKHHEAFFQHVLSRFDPMRDLHFQTNTTIDTLDYSGTGLNAGSKLVLVACGKQRRTLSAEVPSVQFPAWVKDATVVIPGVLAISSNPHRDSQSTQQEIKELESSVHAESLNGFPLIVLTEDAKFLSASFRNFLWVTFTRSNPSHDVHGIGASVIHKHWGCTGPVVIDARLKKHHAPVLEEDSEILARIERHFRTGAPLAGY
jgi:4-hydroxy-3-polyprenylbenzoate decarboxylase